MEKLRERVSRAMRAARWGVATNAILAVVKVVTGLVGNSYALVADGIESTADVASSAVVLGGLRISVRSADERYPFGYGKAESLAAAVVGLMLLVAATVIAVQAWGEIGTPHQVPEAYTLVVLIAVVVTKELLFRRVAGVGDSVESAALLADAWHHRSDAITSAAAAIGISIALIGGPAWAAADDWAALLVSGFILRNGVVILRPAVGALMDRTPGPEVLRQIEDAALAVDGVELIETLKVRRSGLGLFVDLHAEADPEMPLHDAHVLSGKIKTSIRRRMPQVLDVLVHMEPHESERSAEADAGGPSAN